jgi:hypothetical protein
MPVDPQTWVFPPPGAQLPPLFKTSNFGPVYPNDTIVVDWTPSNQVPTIELYCADNSSSKIICRSEIFHQNTDM